METLILTYDEVEKLLWLPEVVESVESALNRRVLDAFRCLLKFFYTTASIARYMIVAFLKHLSYYIARGNFSSLFYPSYYS